MNYNQLKTAATSIISTEIATENLLLELCTMLNKADKKFTWVGFYFMNHANKTLHLGPYVGKPTDHEIIPFGKGICGQVADSGQTYIAEDVQAEENYIACSIDIRSEIVVPIYTDNVLIGQLDIDSNVPNAFSTEDRALLEAICLELGKIKGDELKTIAQKLASQ